MVFHPEAERLQLFSAGEDTTIRLWDLTTSSCVAVLAAHMSAVASLSVSPRGDFLVSGGRDRVVVVWDLATNKSVR